MSLHICFTDRLDRKSIHPIQTTLQDYRTNLPELAAFDLPSRTRGKVDPLDSGAVDEKLWEGEDEAGNAPETNEAELNAKENQPMPQDSDWW